MAGVPNNSETTQYPDLVIVGAGLFGLTVAQQAVEDRKSTRLNSSH